MTDPTTAMPASVPAPSFTPNAINYRGLTDPITPAQVRAFRVATKAAQRANPRISTGLGTVTSVATVVVIAVMGLIFVPLVLFFVVGSFAAALSDGDGSGAAIGLATFFIVGAGIIGAIVFAVIHFTSGQWKKWMRLTQFASDNGLRFRTRNPNPSYQGMIFDIGDTRVAYDHLNSVAGRFFDIGNFQYSTGSGKSRSTSHWGFVALQLDRRLPNMVLDAKANNGIFGMSDLPTHFSRDQVLALEGNFDDYFTLYCPKEYETDALYVFTPDLMALLIDDANSFDVEIVDDWMFVYSRKPFDMLNASTLGRLFSIVATVGAKTVTQTENYHDDRVGSPASNVVAPQGQRLRHGVSLVGVIVLVVIVGFWLLGPALSLFGH